MSEEIGLYVFLVTSNKPFGAVVNGAIDLHIYFIAAWGLFTNFIG
jgi:hypothetical protein